MNAGRFARFNLVGAAGIAVQVGVVWTVTRAWDLPGWVATSAGVAAAVVHNYLWHRRWTWADRPSQSTGVRAFVRFAGANGVVSLAGNVVIVLALTTLTRLGAMPANLAGIAICGLANYWIADRVVFAPTSGVVRTSGPTMSR